MTTIEHAVDVGAVYVSEHSLAPDEARLTLPFVAVNNGRQAAVFAYHMGQATPSGPRQPRKIYFPFLEVRVGIPGFEPTAKHIDADDFNLIVPAREYIGDLGDLLRFDLKTYRARRNRYVEMLSALADQGWLVKSPHTPPELKLAAELSDVLSDISETALEPYYAVAGRDVRKWLANCGHPFHKR